MSCRRRYRVQKHRGEPGQTRGGQTQVTAIYRHRRHEVLFTCCMRTNANGNASKPCAPPRRPSVRRDAPSEPMRILQMSPRKGGRRACSRVQSFHFVHTRPTCMNELSLVWATGRHSMVCSLGALKLCELCTVRGTRFSILLCYRDIIGIGYPTDHRLHLAFGRFTGTRRDNVRDCESRGSSRSFWLLSPLPGLVRY